MSTPPHPTAPASSSDRDQRKRAAIARALPGVSKAFYTLGPMLRDVATRAEHAAKRQEKRRAAAIPQSSYTITCPSCSHEWQTLKVGRRARTCPSCGHVGPREAFAEKPTPTTSDPAATKPAANGEIHVTKPNGEDHKIKRKLGGAAAAAHAAKQRGEPVTVGRPFGGSAKKKPNAAAVNSSTTTKPIGILERLKRVVI